LKRSTILHSMLLTRPMSLPWASRSINWGAEIDLVSVPSNCQEIYPRIESPNFLKFLYTFSSLPSNQFPIELTMPLLVHNI
jgi:hypothetical protein